MGRKRRTAHERSAAAAVGSGPVIDPNRIYTRAEAGKILRLSNTTLQRKIRTKELRSFVQGTRIYVRGAWLLEYVERAPTVGERIHQRLEEFAADPEANAGQPHAPSDVPARG